MTTRHILITGASSGIGAAAAVQFAKQGCALWITYTSSANAAKDVASKCIASGATEVNISSLDLRSPAQIDGLVAEIKAKWGELHVLVNNGGVCPYQGLDDISVDDWDAVEETNSRGTFLLSRASLSLLRAAEASSPGADRAIINVASVAGQIGGLTTSMHYAASKGAILAMTRSLARILAPERIRVNAVSPGPISTAITSHLSDQARTSLEKNVPLGRFGSPEDVAWTISNLASPEAGFVTGATYDVNGGTRID